MPQLDIRRLTTDDEAHLCATLMSTSEPWISLGRGYGESLAIVKSPEREVYVAFDRDLEGSIDAAFRGFLVLTLRTPLGGYISVVAVAHDARSSGIGARLIAHAEARVFRELPNMFLCVSATNPRARALYERLGYEYVGTLKDLLVTGGDEHLMRKTIAPIREYRP